MLANGRPQIRTGDRAVGMSEAAARPELTSGRIHLYVGTGEGQAPAWLGLTARALGAGLPSTVVVSAESSGSLARQALEALSVAATSAKLTILDAADNLAEDLASLVKATAPCSPGLLVLPQALGTPLVDDLRASLQAHCDANPRPPLEIVISGGKAPAWLEDIADLITELRPES